MNAVLLALVTLMGLSTYLEAKTHEMKWASPVQGEAFAYGPYPTCMSGGWGAGKTYVGCQKILNLADTYHRSRWVIARRVSKELRATTMATFYKVCRPDLYDRRLGGRRNDNDGYLKLGRSQSEILFLHFDDPNTAGIIKGLEINGFLIDQGEENPEQMEEIFDLLIGRLGRWDLAEVPQWMIDWCKELGRDWPYHHPENGKPVPPSYAMLAVNPDVELHWIYRRFHEESLEYQQQYKALGYKMFHMPSEENIFLGEENRRFLRQHDDAFIKRNVLGIWGLHEGTIHALDKLSIVEGHPELLRYFREHCTLHRFMDHGDSAATCVLWMAVDRNGNVFWFREYYLPNALISSHRQNITDLSEGERYVLNHADPAIFNPTMQNLKKGRYSVADEYADVVEHPRSNALFWTPGDNNEMATRNRINEYLRVDPERIHPFLLTKGSPRMFFVKANDDYPQGCYHSLRQLRSQRRVKIGTELGKAIYSDERDDSITDHAYDPVRYGMASRPGVPLPPELSKAGTFFAAQQKLANKARGRR